MHERRVIASRGANDRFWHLTDIAPAPDDVCFTPETRHAVDGFLNKIWKLSVFTKEWKSTASGVR